MQDLLARALCGKFFLLARKDETFHRRYRSDLFGIGVRGSKNLNHKLDPPSRLDLHKRPCE
jgi:hypothetical protein